MKIILTVLQNKAGSAESSQKRVEHITRAASRCQYLESKRVHNDETKDGPTISPTFAHATRAKWLPKGLLTWKQMHAEKKAPERTTEHSVK